MSFICLRRLSTVYWLWALGVLLWLTAMAAQIHRNVAAIGRADGRTLRNDGNSTDSVDHIASLYLLSTK